MKSHAPVRRARESSAVYQPAPLGAPDLEKITRHIVRAAHPEMIIFFGSRVYGVPRPDSDVDLMVVINRPNASHAERIADLKKLFSHSPVRLDIQARTPDEVTQRLVMGDEFMQTVVGEGQTLYPRRARKGFALTVAGLLEKGKTNPMNNAPLVLEWVEKAEGDFITAQLIARQKKMFRADNLCWNCQQCVEKYLKAFLTRHRVKFERIHNLDELHALCLAVDSDFRLIKTILDQADICDPQIRYPGKSVSEQEARDAFAAAKEIRKFVRAKLGLR